MKELSISGAYLYTPAIHGDERGTFLEWFRADRLREAVGHDLNLAQGNLSISRRGVIRGVHFAEVPPGQAKFVTCVSGRVMDVVVDIRVGSPTFGRWQSVELNDQERQGVYVGEGLGHAFMALTDQASVVYVCSEPYAPSREHGIHPLDPAVGIVWPQDVEPLLSPKDSVAPTLEEARDKGLLPVYDDCVAYYARLRGGRPAV
ncbi:dTDP-4-dehydrorhamnose 3,5-epimerase [Sphaerisporangium krabiense]|uniref:dTDP-4-dehydrorhamnose 3,5-epimerase n=1 Tax=Sphaerisporangium krabiense TaxID=763782 RepID=A0A7W9DPI5_9ACTN|nr:dTDP-4-dehydrorhamnose 3,5-epimerase [Sphaerisporangium krabiense]MBB5625375.1 dTDP-4-dehydrorhamnose 3,5-epimerase [Sphaerisporangium krabiense]